MKEEKIKDIFDAKDSIFDATDKELDGAVFDLARSKSSNMDGNWSILRMMIINAVREQRHREKVESRNVVLSEKLTARNEKYTKIIITLTIANIILASISVFFAWKSVSLSEISIQPILHQWKVNQNRINNVCATNNMAEIELDNGTKIKCLEYMESKK